MLTEHSLFSPFPSLVAAASSLAHTAKRHIAPARLLATWLTLWAVLRPWLTRGSERARTATLAISRQVALRVQRTRRLSRARFRYLAGSLIISMRNLQWRQHASSLLIATMIMIAVARSQTSPDGR